MSSSVIDHPAYYGGENNPYEAIKVIEAWGLGFCLGNAVKYICRAGKKISILDPSISAPAPIKFARDENATIEDLKKARWYLDREIQRLTATGTDPKHEGPENG